MQESILQSKIKRKKRNRIKYYIEEIAYGLLKMFVLVMIILILRQSVGGVAIVYGKSMEPSFAEGDRIIYVHMGYEPQRGDVVLCRTGKGNTNELIKRIVGMPGDVIDIDEQKGTVSVNGNVLDEPYLNDNTKEKGDVDYPLTVPPGQYFVLGDNRNASLDSRFSEIGTLAKERIDGHVILRIFPFSKMEIIE